MGVLESVEGPGDHLRAAEAELQNGRPDRAEQLCRALIAREPKDAAALLFLGTLEARNGKLVEAAATLQKMLQLQPGHFEGWNWLAAIYREQGNLKESIACAKKACDLQPNLAASFQNLAVSQYMAGDFAAAEQSYKRASGLEPENPQHHLNLALTYEALKRYSQAEQAYQEVLAKAPNDCATLERLAHFLLRIEKREEAMKWLRKLLQIQKNDPANFVMLCRTLVEANYNEEAYELLHTAVEQDSSQCSFYPLLATVCQRFGRFEEANQYLDKVIELDPTLAWPYFQKLSGNKVEEKDRPLIEKAALVAGRCTSLPDLELLNYGLGKAFNDLGEYAKAMQHYDAANRAAAQNNNAGRKYSRESAMRQVDRIIATFTPAFIERNAEQANRSEMPIIVCGMPRSGTTLTSQILSCHPTIGSAGELQFWTSHMEQVWASPTRLDPGQVRAFADEYLDQLRGSCPGKKYVVDKMPQNFYTAGLIHIAFPNARIIHCRRNPVDNCLSIYFAPFHDPMEYCHVRENIVFAYRCYLRVVDHWRKTLPKDRFLEIDYEDLATNPEPAIAKMLDFIGVEWDDACLRPHENTRVVATASIWQARQPIFRTSVERWRNFEPWLGAFAELLDAKNGTAKAA